MSERDAEEEVRALRAALAAERAKGAAFAELSHELRTLIAGVIGLTGLLLETELDPEQRDCVKRVRGFSDALVGLVNNVLDYSRFEAGKLDLERAPLDVRRLVDEVGELCADRARAKGIELVASVAPDVPGLLRGDPTRVRQVLLNLVSNGLKFTDQGEVVLRLALTELDAESAVLRVEVRDTGVGITAEGQERLFRPFSQVHAGNAGGGSGLGLALSKQIVEAMGGTIGVISEPGRGSTFHCTLRLERHAGAHERSAIPRVDMAGRRVLCAAPNAETRACLAEMTHPLGVTFHPAVSREDALAELRRAARKGAYDVLLLDANLPGASDLLHAMDAEEALAALPVVVLAYPGQRWDGAAADGEAQAVPVATAARSSGRQTGRRPTGPRPSTRVVASLAKPVRQAQLHACLRTLMGSTVETLAAAPDSRRGGHVEPRPQGHGPAGHDGGRPAGSRAHRAGPPSSRRAGGLPRAPSETTPAADRPRVLLVEDNAVNQRVARLMMEKRGYQIDVAADGHEAIEATRKTVYAAVLMDCHMPRCDGYSATEEIRRRDAGGARVPIIAMTANAGPGARERCLGAGMDDYISKPVTSDALDDVLRRWVSRAPPPVEPPSRKRPSSPPVDLTMLRKLRMTQGASEPDIVGEVVALFLHDAPARVAGIREAAERGDLPVASRAAHTLKGSAGHLGAKTLAALCARFEEKVRAGAPFNVSFAVGAIAAELDRVREALATEPAGEPPSARAVSSGHDERPSILPGPAGRSL